MVYRFTHTRLLAGVLFLLWLSGCSHTIPREVLPADIPDRSELVDTPFYAQQRYQCGPASLAMVLEQRGVKVSPDELVAKVYLPERQGSVAPEMVATARSYGMLVYEIPPSLDALLHEVAAGNPVLVLQNLGLSWLPKWHYAVVMGYDMESQQIALRSGTIERHQISMALFERTWRRGKRWGMALLRPGELPASNDHLSYLKAAYALEQTQQYESALLAYASASRRWQSEQIVWLAQSNLQYRLGHYSEAEQTLRLAIAHHPESSELWNNLAYSLAEQGCRETAFAAVDCAIQLTPDEPGYLQSRGDITNMAGRTSAPCVPVSCPVASEAISSP